MASPKLKPNKVKETDLFGVIFLNAGNSKPVEGYYTSLDAIRPLVESEAWLETVTGFYINASEDPNDENVVNVARLSYFTRSADQAIKVVEDLIVANRLEHAKDPDIPKLAKVSEIYSGGELRFRKYLSTYTQIGLDIMKKKEDQENARYLFTTFRWQVMRGNRPYKPHFERTFESDSPFYKKLSPDQKAHFWSDLSFWPNPPQVDWAHMFVNMVLAQDFPNPPITPPLPFPPLTSQELNKLSQLHDHSELSIIQIDEELIRQRLKVPQIPIHWRP